MLQRAAVNRQLHFENAWLALGHYRPALGGEFRSDADDPSFFLAAAGSHDPRVELEATIAGLLEPGGGDEHPQCRFPARLHWLERQLGAPFPRVECPGFEKWRDTLKAHTVSLIFPAAYLNSPSSMFGHTFLRLDQAGQTQDGTLLAYTINYAADASEADNELLYAYRGLFGGYRGVFSLLPYYQKVKEYRDMENRDIWEYSLNLRADEVQQLVRHIWEIHAIRFDYYFIGENCSYRLLSLLDVARPQLNLRRQFSLRAIPSETVRAIADIGLIERATYRASAATTLSSHLAPLSLGQKKLAKSLADGQLRPDAPAVRRLPPTEQAVVLDTAYEFYRYQSIDQKWSREATANAGLRLLRARSRLAIPSGLRTPETPDYRDDQGHRPNLLGLGFGYRADKAYGEVTVRSAYHDLTDPWPGFRMGAQIKFFDGSLRYSEDQQFKLERLDVLNLKSISPRDDFFQPVSWSVSLGAQRRLFRASRPLLGSFSADAGLAYAFAGGLLYGMAGATFEAGESLSSGVDIGFGPRLGWVYRGFGGQGLLNFSADCFVVEGAWCGGKLSLQHVINVGQEYAIKLGLSREQGKHRSANEIGLSVQRYF